MADPTQQAVRANWRAGSVGLALLAAAGLFSPLAEAGQASASFSVQVALQPAVARSGLCKQSQSGNSGRALITVDCSTGTVFDIETPAGYFGRPSLPMHGAAHRYLLQVTPRAQAGTSVDAHVGRGTITGGQLVKTSRQEYLEILLGW